MRRLLLVLGSIIIVLALVVVVPILVRDGTTRAPFVGPSLAEVPHEQINFTYGDLQLAGMLLRPEGDQPEAVAVFIHGAGTSNRDNPWYLLLADTLRQNNVAVVLPDKRGSEQSDGDWRTASFGDLAGDALAAIGEARDLYPGVPVGIVGASQGGWVAPIVANGDPSLAFVINLSGSAVTPEEQLVHEEANNLRQMGAFGIVADALAPITAYSIRAFRQSEFWDAISGFEPNQYWADVTVPTFVAYGAWDENDNVPVEESVRRLEGLDNPAIEVAVYPGAGHALEDIQTGVIEPAFLDDFIAAATRQ